MISGKMVLILIVERCIFAFIFPCVCIAGFLSILFLEVISKGIIGLLLEILTVKINFEKSLFQKKKKKVIFYMSYVPGKA